MSDYKTTKDLVISVPLPTQTRTYKPIPNKQLVDLTLEGLQKAGLSLARETYTSARDGNIATGRYTIANVDDSEMQLQVMWRNSYDKSKSLTFSVGCMIKVCSNGMMRSTNTDFFRRKHTGDIQEFAPQRIGEYLKGASEIFTNMQKEREIMKTIELTRETQAELIGKMFIEHDFIKSTQLNIIKRELNSPTHSYGSPNSLWSLYQYSTFAMREIHPSLYLQDHIKAHEFFTEQSDIIISEGGIIHNTADVRFKQLDWVEELSKEHEQA